MRKETAVLLFALCLFPSAPVPGAELNWSEIAQEEETTIIVDQEDGVRSEITIWFAVIDGRGYIRTREDMSWRAEIRRDPNVSLRFDGRDYPIRVSVVADGALYESVNAAYTEKYGLMSDVILAMMRPFLGPWIVYRADSR